jgi:hypothetical protein
MEIQDDCFDEGSMFLPNYKVVAASYVRWLIPSSKQDIAMINGPFIGVLLVKMVMFNKFQYLC